jgi:hypothetical protein
MSEDLTLIAVYGVLREACRKAGGQKAWGEKHGFSASFVSDVLNAKRPIPDSVVAALGLVKVVRYRPAKSCNRRIAA